MLPTPFLFLLMIIVEGQAAGEQVHELLG